MVCRLAGRYDEAIDDLTRAVELDQENAEAYLRRAITFTEQCRFDLALADFTEAESLDPELAPV
jgi:tetratricopeptide (TPR) repeat protein